MALATSEILHIKVMMLAIDQASNIDSSLGATHLVYHYQPLYFHAVDHITDIRVPDPGDSLLSLLC